ncbi:hypothetical protein HAV15_006848 [Penicillium sp. str. |nr:hypothetical protein HAV15_006848 [Penicillium sp. str. \
MRKRTLSAMSSPDSDGHDVIMVGLEDVRDFNLDNILPLPPPDIPTAYNLERSEYSRHRLSYLAGTGKWLTSTTTFQQWHQGDEDGLLSVKGIPGSGKSVLAASIINQLQKDGIPVIFFFFRQIIDANHQPVSALRDWLCQLLDYSPALQAKLKNYIDGHRSLDSLSPTDLWKDLKLALATFPRVYCVTDALDEMDQGNDEFLHALSQNTLNTKVDFIEAGTTITKTIFQELIDRGANSMAQDNDGNTILHHLKSFRADSELFKILKEVIIKNPGLLNQPNKNGETIFHRILILKDFDLIDDLLELGANPLQPDLNGNTALHHLAKHLDKSQAHFKRFLKAGVDINPRNNQGDAPLFKYIESYVVAPGSYQDDGSYEKEDNLTEAMLNFFDEAGAGFFAQNNAGSSLLHLLASKKFPAKSSHNVVRRFQILMDRGLDPLAEDARQRTSLDVAAVCGSDHIMKLFARKPME